MSKDTGGPVMPDARELIEKLERHHDELNCMVRSDGLTFKSDADKAAEIERAMADCWQAASALREQVELVERYREALATARTALQELGRLADWGEPFEICKKALADTAWGAALSGAPDDRLTKTVSPEESRHYRPHVEQAFKDMDDGWIKHDGGECPVGGSVRVLYRFRNDKKPYGPIEAGLLDWTHSLGDREDSYPDIVAYRVAGDGA